MPTTASCRRLPRCGRSWPPSWVCHSRRWWPPWRDRRATRAESGEPPGHGAPGGEEFGSALAGALPEEESGNEADKNGSGGDDPINCVEVHRSEERRVGKEGRS